MEFKQKGFFKRVASALTDRTTLNAPIIVKSATETSQLIAQYKQENENSIDATQLQKLHEKIKLLELGLKGEQSVLYELQNSFLPIHILHDVRIIHKDLRCQMDFVVLTRKFILVIEVKNYYGNILINDKDEFIRQVYKGNKLAFQEGFYSPVRQVERQTEVFTSYLKDKGAVSKTPIKSIVVFTNNKTVINTKYASKHVKEKIMRVDRLVDYIKRELEKPSPVLFQDKRMTEMSDYIKASHTKFAEEEIESVELKLLTETIQEPDETQPSPVQSQQNHADLEAALKKFRMKLANEQNVKAYHIFTNKTLDDLLLKQPQNLNDLKSIYGLGEAKINSFGKDLIELIKGHQ